MADGRSRTSSPSLAEVEALFVAAVTAPAGVDAALAERGEDDARLARWAAGSPSLTARDRLAIYADMYRARLGDALADEFPRLALHLDAAPPIGDGADGFQRMASAYLVAHRPSSPTLRDVGARLFDFLATDAAHRACPWRAAVARLEWARVECFDAVDAEVRTVDELRAIARVDGGAALADLTLPLVPAHRLLPRSAVAAALWEEPTSDPRRLAGEGAERALLVWRHEGRVLHRPLDAVEEPLLVAARDGESFGALCERLATTQGTEAAAPIALRLLVAWAEEGLLARR